MFNKVRYYYSNNDRNDCKKSPDGNYYTETKSTLIDMPLDKVYLVEVSIVSEFYSRRLHEAGIYAIHKNGKRILKNEKSFEMILHEFSFNAQEIKAIAQIELVDVSTNKYSIHVRARTVELARIIFTMIREGKINPAISFEQEKEKSS